MALVLAGLATAAVAAALAFLPEGSKAATAVDDGATTATAALAAVLAARRARLGGAPRRPWALLAVALGFIALGEFYWLLSDFVLNEPVGLLSAADPAYYLGYLFALAALAGWFPRREGRYGPFRQAITVVIVVASLELAAWLTFLRRATTAEGMGTAEVLVAAAYPAMDIAVAAAFLVVARVTELPERVPILLVGLGFLAWMVGDLAYAVLAVQGAYSSGFLLAALWVGGYLLVAVAALWPTSAPSAAPSKTPAFQRLDLVPTAAVLVALLGGGVAVWRGVPVDRVALAYALTMVLGLLFRQHLFALDVRHAQRSLSDREGKLAEAQAIAHLGSWEWDAAHDQASLSKETCRIFGYEAGRGPSTVAQFMACIHPDDRPAMAANFQSVMERGNGYDMEMRIVRSDGAVRWIRNRGRVAARSPDGRPVRLAGTCEDVTERKTDEAQLQLLFRNSPAIISRYDQDLRLLLTNLSPTSLPGLDLGDPRGKRPSEMNGVDPAEATQAERLLREVLATGEPRTWNFVVPLSGGRRNFHSSFFPEKAADGSVKTVVHISHDVTDLVAAEERLRDSEAQLRSLLDNLDEVFFSGYLDGRPGIMSRGAERLFGRPLADFQRDPGLWAKMIHPDDQARVMAGYARRIATGEAEAEDARVVRPDGAVRHVRTSIHPVKDATGKVVRVDGIIRDVTAEREAAEQAQNVRELKEQSEFKTQFLNMAAHELATPITPIKLQLAMLRNRPDIPTVERDGLAVLDRNLGRLGSLVQDLLEAARLQGGRMRLAAKPLPLRRLAADLQATFAEKARLEGVSLAIEAEEVEMVADEARLQQVLTNLLHNAIKFTPAGGSVRLVGRRAGDNVEIRITDTGAGLEPDQVSRLFEPFSQVHDPAVVPAQSKGGTGLGLYISRGIIERHGGRIGVESAGRGMGSTFWFQIPVAGPPSAPVIPSSPAAA
ncbi:MAG TPA: PAS domain-containing protein [Candidatus Thermoplasmatota archaeon]|nr:PAS domain-containing protein [Candidatus Thermoplasmatota archaeon]